MAGIARLGRCRPVHELFAYLSGVRYEISHSVETVLRSLRQARNGNAVDQFSFPVQIESFKNHQGGR